MSKSIIEIYESDIAKIRELNDGQGTDNHTRHNTSDTSVADTLQIIEVAFEADIEASFERSIWDYDFSIAHGDNDCTMTLEISPACQIVRTLSYRSIVADHDVKAESEKEELLEDISLDIDSSIDDHTDEELSVLTDDLAFVEQYYSPHY